MKSLFLSSVILLATVFVSAASAANETIKGEIRFVKTSTVTCAAIGCPPSEPYWQVELINPNISGAEVVRLHELTTEPGLGNEKMPKSIMFKKFALKNGQKVVVTGEVRRFKFSTAYLTMIKIESITNQ